ncbi:hypothetical protein J4G02_18760, partial [Candidatus Poribacteria bacterium]|nr:hypothetical protein [Candidatus Poribacteria bacterium]
HVQIRQSVPTNNPLNPPYQGDFGKCPLICLIHHSWRGWEHCPNDLHRRRDAVRRRLEEQPGSGEERWN